MWNFLTFLVDWKQSILHHARLWPCQRGVDLALQDGSYLDYHTVATAWASWIKGGHTELVKCLARLVTLRLAIPSLQYDTLVFRHDAHQWPYHFLTIILRLKTLFAAIKSPEEERVMIVLFLSARYFCLLRMLLRRAKSRSLSTGERRNLAKVLYLTQFFMKLYKSPKALGEVKCDMMEHLHKYIDYYLGKLFEPHPQPTEREMLGALGLMGSRNIPSNNAKKATKGLSLLESFQNIMQNFLKRPVHRYYDSSEKPLGMSLDDLQDFRLVIELVVRNVGNAYNAHLHKKDMMYRGLDPSIFEGPSLLS